MSPKALNILTTIIGIIVAIAIPMYQYVTANHLGMADWPLIVAGIAAGFYFWALNHPGILPITQARVTSIAASICGAMIALEPLVATGTLTLQTAATALMATLIGLLTGNPQGEDILDKELAQIGFKK